MTVLLALAYGRRMLLGDDRIPTFISEVTRRVHGRPLLIAATCSLFLVLALSQLGLLFGSIAGVIGGLVCALAEDDGRRH